MEERFKKDDRILSELMTEAGLESPSLSFDNNVMRAIKELDSKSIAYQPLITKRTWIIIAIAFVALLTAIFLMGPAEPGLLGNLIGDTGISLPEWNIPRGFVYAIAFLGLFCIQIPILKSRPKITSSD